MQFSIPVPEELLYNEVHLTNLKTLGSLYIKSFCLHDDCFLQHTSFDEFQSLNLLRTINLMKEDETNHFGTFFRTLDKTAMADGGFPTHHTVVDSKINFDGKQRVIIFPLKCILN